MEKQTIDITPKEDATPVTTSVTTVSDNVPNHFEAQLQYFTEIAKDSNTGINTPAMAIMLYNKAKELGIGWANAVSHMHLIKGKLGIDIHIVKAIMSRPGSGIRVVKLEDYRPLYKYTDKSLTTTWTDDTLPEDAQVVNKFSDPITAGKFPVIILPTIIKDSKGAVIGDKIEPYDYRTKYKFIRKKRDIDGSYFTEERISSFSWLEAVQAQLPFDKAGNLNPDSNWAKYRKLMIDTRAYTYGARDIASDLLLGAYETTELYDMNKEEYTISPEIQVF